MAEPPLNASLPEGLILDAGYQITLDAIDPATGATVAGVIVTRGTVTAGEALGAGLGGGQLGPFMFVPGPRA